MIELLPKGNETNAWFMRSSLVKLVSSPSWRLAEAQCNRHLAGADAASFVLTFFCSTS